MALSTPRPARDAVRLTPARLAPRCRRKGHALVGSAWPLWRALCREGIGCRFSSVSRLKYSARWLVEFVSGFPVGAGLESLESVAEMQCGGFGELVPCSVSSRARRAGALATFPPNSILPKCPTGHNRCFAREILPFRFFPQVHLTELPTYGIVGHSPEQVT